MKNKIVKKRIIKFVLVVVLLSLPYIWFKIHANSFLKHSFNSVEDVRIDIWAAKTDVSVELESRSDKNTFLNVLQSELEYEGPLWYRVPFQVKGEHEIYCIRIDDYSDNSGSWVMYISDNPEQNYLMYDNVFGTKFAVNTELLEIIGEYVK